MSVSTDESVLIRECAGLYASFALEGLANFMLGLTFLYLILLISCKNELEMPGRAVCRLVWRHVKEYVDDWWNNLKTWPSMPFRPLDQRFAFCRKMNLSICFFSAGMAFLALTRWLHVGNVNGFRYIGYAVTCPIMQAELIVLLAPVMPFYRTNVTFILAITCICMLSGYVGSLFDGYPWEGNLLGFLQTFDIADLAPRTKFWVVLPSFLCMGLLVCVQIPCLALVFLFSGGMKANENLPYHYLRLLLLVAVTWSAFPVWWLLSSEGFGVIHDTKLNGFGFCFLNITSKGLFTLTMLSMVKSHRRTWQPELPAETPKNAAAAEPWLLKFLRPYDGENFDLEAGQVQQPAPAPCKAVSFGFAASELRVEAAASDVERGCPSEKVLLGRETSTEWKQKAHAEVQTVYEEALFVNPESKDEDIPSLATVAVVIEGDEPLPPRMCQYMCAF